MQKNKKTSQEGLSNGVNKKSDNIISYRDLHQDKEMPSSDFVVEKYSFNIRTKKIVAQTKVLFERASIFVNDHFYLLIKSAAENHLRIQQCKIKPIEGEACNLTFGSYTELKKYQKKVRLFTYSTSSTMASVLIAILVMQVFFPSSKSLGATFTFNQTGWSGGATSEKANHLTDQNGWNKFESKDANISSANGGADLQLTSIAATKVETSDTDFNAGAKTNVATNGTGDGANIKMGKEIIQLAGGEHFSLALKSDGTVWGWGTNPVGQLGDNTTTGRLTPVQVKGVGGVGYLTGVIAIAASRDSAIALKGDGTVWAWGNNNRGQSGNSSAGDTKLTPVQVKGVGGVGYLTGITAITMGYWHALALKNDGTVWAWGGGLSGQLGVNTSLFNSDFPLQVVGAGGSGYLTGVIAVSGGVDHSLALKNDGTVWAWGDNTQGQLGDNTTTYKYAPVQVLGSGGSGYLTDVTSIVASVYYSLALKSDGTVWAWGNNNTYGQLGDNTAIDRTTPVQVKGVGGVGYLTGIITISGGGEYSLALKGDGTVWGWGVNTAGQLGDNTATNRSTPVQVKGVGGVGYLTDIITITGATYGNHSLALKSDGTVWAWGYNYRGQLGDNTWTARFTPVQSWNVPSGFLSSVAAPASPAINTIAAGTNSAGTNYSLALKSDGTVWAWGQNNYGQLGDNTVIDKSTPVQVSGLTGVSAVAAGLYYSLALKSDGTVWAWGNNASGQLGDNTTTQRNTPVQVKDTAGTGYLTGIIAISGSNLSNYSFAVKNDGTVWGWGVNTAGQLGDNTTTQRNTPVQVKDTAGTGYLTGITAITAGASLATMALKDDGTVWAWGQNNYGQLGDNTTTSHITPAQVLGSGGSGYLTGVTGVTNNDTGFLVVKGDGTVWAWGLNNQGQLGDNTTTQRKTPVQVLGSGGSGYLTGITAISGFNYNSLALKNDGTVWAWGYNASGQLGDNTTTAKYTPVQVLGSGGSGYLTGVVAISKSLAVKSDGTVWAWGNNSNGQLGDNTTTQRNTPVQTKAWNLLTDYLSVGLTYKTSGIFTSQVLDTGQKSNYTTLAYNQAIVANTSITVDMRFGNTDLVDGSWTAWQSGLANSTSLAAFSGNRYFQYRLNFSSNGTATPQFDDLTASYSSYSASQSLLSSAYNTSSFANSLAKIGWTEALPENTDIKFQMRTAPDNASAPDWANGSGWCGPTTCAVTTGDTDYAADFYQTTPAGESSNELQKSGNDDQWVQYRATLISDGQYTPTLSDTVLTYAVNANPEIQNIVSSQGADNKVTTTFELRDPDTTTGATNGSVLGGLQYCTANCQTPGSETWTAATALTFKNGSGNTLPNSALVIEEVNYTPYTIVWDPKTDYSGQYLTNLKVRVTANDSEAANNLGYGNAVIDVFDTKNPTSASVVIDHTKSTNNLTLTTPVDDSTYQIAYSNYSDFRDVLEADYLTFPTDNQKTYTNLTQDPATVYVRVKDAKGNYTDTSATTPAKPQHVVYYDTSNAASNEYREFVAWDVIAETQSGAGFGSYKVYRADRLESDPTADLSYNLVGTITDRNTNFYTDLNLSNSSHYYYKIVATDINGNISQYSSVVEDNPNGQGGSDQTPPTISAVSVSNINTTSATVTWTTDELADSGVGYSEGTSYLPERGLASMTFAHEITLTGLAPDNTYNIRVKSRDPIGNLGQNDKDNPGSTLIQNFTFSTLPGPAISGVTIPNVSNTQATIEWKTTTDSSSFIVYSDTASSGVLVDPKEFGTPDLVGNPTNGKYVHSQTITTYNDLPLVPNTRYYFYVKSVDAENNVSIENNGGNFYELLTTEDSNPPIISNITVPIISYDSVAINWNTDEPATSKVSYKKHSAANYSDSEEVLTYDRGHYIILANLESDTAYDFKVISKDINTNSVTSDPQEFTTTKNIEFQHEPLATITFAETNPSILTDIVSVISFDTDQNANCFVEYGTESDNYSSVPAKEGKDLFNRGHNIQLNGLVFLTKYFYKVTCQDNLETVVASQEKDFTTKEQYFTAAGAGALGDHIPPVINNVKVASVTGESATVTWDTDEETNSIVAYGNLSVDENVAGDQLVNKNKDNFNTAHSVLINGLIPATKYIFVASSTDASGNISQSTESSFTTASPSSLSSIKVESKNLGEATITWKTGEDTTSTVEYGLTTSYGEKKESNTLTQEHSISLSNLNQGTTYHYRVKGKDENGRLFASADNTFEPKSPAQITDVTINDITEHGATVTFKTNVPTDAQVIYTDLKDNQSTGAQGIRELTTEHKIELANLNQGTTFGISISVKDEQGTEATAKGQDFTTGQDQQAPKIENIKTDSALTQSDKVQTIISWKTDEQASTSILYKEGRNGEERELKITDNLTTSHIGVITIFKPGTVYNFRVKSIDASGNEAISNDFALLTPRKRENIIQIIIGNFTDIFGWAKF